MGMVTRFTDYDALRNVGRTTRSTPVRENRASLLNAVDIGPFGFTTTRSFEHRGYTPDETPPVKKHSKVYFPDMQVSIPRKEDDGPLEGTLTAVDHHTIYVDRTPHSLKGLKGVNIKYDAIRDRYYLEVRT